MLTRENLAGIGLYGASISLAALGAFIIGSMWFGMYSNGDPNYAVITVSFLTLTLAQLWQVFNMRDIKSGFFKNEITVNEYMWGALGLCSALILAAVFVPGLSTVLKTTNPEVKGRAWRWE